ncbi:MAG: hypothetical protein KDJ87_13965, partial [Rhizobiaceae bacterium]|nr:hypothetical protein [Rhizobiaceae bacterium]
PEHDVKGFVSDLEAGLSGRFFVCREKRVPDKARPSWPEGGAMTVSYNAEQRIGASLSPHLRAGGGRAMPGTGGQGATTTFMCHLGLQMWHFNEAKMPRGLKNINVKRREVAFPRLG